MILPVGGGVIRVIGLLSFYDEQAGHLTDAIKSLADAGVDHLVAVDGAYALYPGGEPSSPVEQHDAIRDAAGDAGIGLTTFTPLNVWAGNEVEKRTKLFELGHQHAQPGVDWLFVFDADETITHANGWREQLEQTQCDVCAVLHGEPGVRPRTERRLFRAHEKGISVRRAHFYYIDGGERVLWGPGQIDRELVDVQILHRPLTRSKARNAGRNGYYEARLMNNVEVGLW